MPTTTEACLSLERLSNLEPGTGLCAGLVSQTCSHVPCVVFFVALCTPYHVAWSLRLVPCRLWFLHPKATAPPNTHPLCVIMPASQKAFLKQVEALEHYTAFAPGSEVSVVPEAYHFLAQPIVEQRTMALHVLARSMCFVMCFSAICHETPMCAMLGMYRYVMHASTCLSLTISSVLLACVCSMQEPDSLDLEERELAIMGSNLFTRGARRFPASLSDTEALDLFRRTYHSPVDFEVRDTHTYTHSDAHRHAYARARTQAHNKIQTVLGCGRIISYVQHDMLAVVLQVERNTAGVTFPPELAVPPVKPATRPGRAASSAAQQGARSADDNAETDSGAENDARADTGDAAGPPDMPAPTQEVRNTDTILR